MLMHFYGSICTTSMALPTAIGFVVRNGIGSGIKDV